MWHRQLYKLFMVAKHVSWYRCWYPTWYVGNMMVTTSVPNLRCGGLSSILLPPGGRSNTFFVLWYFVSLFSENHRCRTHFIHYLEAQLKILISWSAEYLCWTKTNNQSWINKRWCQTFISVWRAVFIIIINCLGQNIADRAAKLFENTLHKGCELRGIVK